jgi:CheY-like chemotaxis protein
MSASQRVLVVDDDLLNQEVISEFLAIGDYTIDLADDGQQAVEMVESNDYDLVLMDIMMPHMDGIEATTKIRALADPSKAKTPVIAITARNPDTDQAIWFAIGVNDFVGKPFSEEEFIQVVSPYI